MFGVHCVTNKFQVDLFARHDSIFFLLCPVTNLSIFSSHQTQLVTAILYNYLSIDTFFDQTQDPTIHSVLPTWRHSTITGPPAMKLSLCLQICNWCAHKNWQPNFQSILGGSLYQLGHNQTGSTVRIESFILRIRKDMLLAPRLSASRQHRPILLQVRINTGILHLTLMVDSPRGICRQFSFDWNHLAINIESATTTYLYLSCMSMAPTIIDQWSPAEVPHFDTSHSYLDTFRTMCLVHFSNIGSVSIIDSR